MKKTVIVGILLLLCSACRQPATSTTPAFFSGTDSYQRPVTLSAEPQRIISLSASVTEIMFLLHAADKLVGITDFCNYPPETDTITKVGKLLNINVETLLSLRPDLVIISSIVSKESVDKMEHAGITVFAIKEEQHLSDLLDIIEMVGVLVNRQQEAAALRAEYQQQLAASPTAAADTQPSVYYVVGFGATGDFTAPGNSYIHDIIARAGGNNIGSDLRSWNVSRELLFQQNPDHIFIRKEDLETFRNAEPYCRLTAVKENRLHPIESGWIDNVSPRNFLAISYMDSLIH